MLIIEEIGGKSNPFSFMKRDRQVSRSGLVFPDIAHVFGDVVAQIGKALQMEQHFDEDGAGFRVAKAFVKSFQVIVPGLPHFYVNLFLPRLDFRAPGVAGTVHHGKGVGKIFADEFYDFVQFVFAEQTEFDFSLGFLEGQPVDG